MQSLRRVRLSAGAARATGVPGDTGGETHGTTTPPPPRAPRPREIVRDLIRFHSARLVGPVGEPQQPRAEPDVRERRVVAQTACAVQLHRLVGDVLDGQRHGRLDDREELARLRVRVSLDVHQVRRLAHQVPHRLAVSPCRRVAGSQCRSVASCRAVETREEGSSSSVVRRVASRVASCRQKESARSSPHRRAATRNRSREGERRERESAVRGKERGAARVSPRCPRALSRCRRARCRASRAACRTRRAPRRART